MLKIMHSSYLPNSLYFYTETKLFLYYVGMIENSIQSVRIFFHSQKQNENAYSERIASVLLYNSKKHKYHG